MVRDHGFAAVRQRARSRLHYYRKADTDLLADVDDIMRFRIDSPFVARPVLHEGPLTVNWLLPGIAPHLGGFEGTARMVQFLEARGHTCRIYLTWRYNPLTLGEQVSLLRSAFPAIRARVYADPRSQAPAHACIATGWHTAYCALVHGGDAARFYMVQDFEPLFQPAGTLATLAENTYRMNFFGLTLGPWLSAKLSAEYGMKCAHFQFGADSITYRRTNFKPRNDILFYARRSTPRRGYELGILALRILHQMRPDVQIHLVGGDQPRERTGFPYAHHGTLSHTALAALYNQCAAGLVLSFTNASFLPFELLVAGCTPVINDSNHLRASLRAGGIVFAPPTPHELADALARAVTTQAGRPSQGRLHEDASVMDEPPVATWEVSGEHFEQHLVERVRAGW